MSGALALKASWGSAYAKTPPRIDENGRRGTVFINNYTQATGTIESVPSIFSSRYYSLDLSAFFAEDHGLARGAP